MKTHASFLLTTLLMGIAPLHAAPAAAASYYTGEKIYQSRPDAARDTPFGGIGTTGVMARVYPGVIVKVEGMKPGSPAEGKFSKGEIITGINGVSLKGLNPFVACGQALTKAEASDGRMEFDVTSADGKTTRKETVSIPVLGTYSKTWPLDCKKSKNIIEQAAGFYSDPAKFKQGGIPGALACLFLLSTGDDRYLPQVKAYFDAFPRDLRAIGDHTWNNGYNGIACGEYYLRTGDTSVLPILQHYCDDAKARQKFGCGWTHWGQGVNPGYVAGGLMNPAGAQVLTTLLLGKECGVNVDEETLLGALRFFYRFAGHGTVGAFDELEKLLRDADPRVRRAALDGLIDYNYWFGIGKNPIPADKFTPKMLEPITKMVKDRKESWWVVDGALMALKFTPAKDIQTCMPLILPWADHSDWWLRESAFMALSGLEKDDTLYLEILPKLLAMATREYHTQPRERMMNHLEGVLKRKKPSSPAGKLIVEGLQKSIATSEIKSGPRSPEGAFNVIQAAKACLQTEPTSAVAVAHLVQERMSDFGTGDLINLVAAPNANPEGRPYGLITTLEKLPAAQREELTDFLFKVYRAELIQRMNTEKVENQPLVDTIIDLTKLRTPDAGWKPLGKIPPAERIWRFTSFDPLTEKDRMHPREKRRFREIALPENLKGWQTPDYDDSQWTQGPALIGIGEFKRGSAFFPNKSDWGKGEFLVMRTTFDVDALDYDSYRLNILARQGFRVFLNGHAIDTYGWWKDMPHYRPIVLGAGQIKHLKKGNNVLAAYGNVEYNSKDQAPCGQMDLCIEGLRKSDLK